MHHQVGKGDHLRTLVCATCTLELHENIVIELLNLAPTSLTLVYMACGAQLSTSNGANVLVSNAFSLSFQGIHSHN
jgi:energy-converting hydrogenase Eha subunit G